MPDADQREQLTRQDDNPGNKTLNLQEVLDLYDDAKKYINDGPRKDWDRYFRVYKGQRVVRNYEGVSDPVIRESHTIIETLVANIASGNPKFHFVPTNEEQAKDTDVINEMLDYYLLCNQMALKNQEWVREMLLYGTAILGVEWREGKPFIFNIPLRDFFVDPTSTGLVSTINPALYGGYEYLADIDVMKSQEIYDADQKKWVPRYKNLDKIGSMPSPKGGDGGANKMDKAFKDMFVKSTLGDKATENQMHVIKLYHLPTGRLIEVGNKKEIIYDQPTWCQREQLNRSNTAMVDEQPVEYQESLDEIKPFLPFAVLRDYIDSSQFYAEGEMALLFYDAELLNDYEAMQIDNNAYQNTPMYWIDPQFADLAPEIETIPGAVYPIPRNAMGALERPQLTGDIDNKQEKILQRMRRATAADEAVQGVAQQQSRTTATEVSTQIQQAQLRFATKLSNLESEGYAQLGLLIFKMVQIFVTQRTAVRIVGKDGVYFKDFDPWEYNGEWEAHVQLDSTIKQKQVEVGLKDQSVYEAAKDNPQINQVELLRWWVKKKDPTMTDELFNSWIIQPKPQPVSRDYVTAQYKDLEPWAKMQFQKDVGWETDPSLQGDVRNRFLEQANVGADHLNPTTDASGKVVPGVESALAPPQPSPASAPPELAAAGVPAGA